MINWTLGVYSIRSLKANAKNPRQISKEQFQHLAASIAKFGFIDRPIINTDLTIICGHQRIRVLKKQQTKTVECWMPDRTLDEKEIDELMIRHNLNQGTFDYDILSNLFEPLDLLEYGFTECQLIGCFEEKEEKEKASKEEKKTKCPCCGHEF